MTHLRPPFLLFGLASVVTLRLRRRVRKCKDILSLDATPPRRTFRQDGSLWKTFAGFFAPRTHSFLGRSVDLRSDRENVRLIVSPISQQAFFFWSDSPLSGELVLRARSFQFPYCSPHPTAINVSRHRALLAAALDASPRAISLRGVLAFCMTLATFPPMPRPGRFSDIQSP